MNQRAFFNWSGGKDSAFALYHVLNDRKFDISCLLTTVNKEYRRISMHGVREELLDVQAGSTGLELQKLYLPEYAPMEVYDDLLAEEVKKLKNAGTDNAIFGDIFLEDLREYREKKLREAGVSCYFPLWKKNTAELIKQFVGLGFKTIITSVDERYLDKSFAGRIIDADFLSDLPDSIDPCGENGEFHSFVFDGPIFKHPVKIKKGELTYRKYDNGNGDELKTGFWYCDVLME